MAWIKIKGIKTHNLKNLDIAIPQGRFICITGPSGSGKSSLAFDTLYKEGKYRYLETLALGFSDLSNLDRPSLDYVESLPPTIALEQKIAPINPRSTVGTFTKVIYFLRLLFLELGQIKCPKCNCFFRPYTLQEILEDILSLPKGSKIYILSPLKRCNSQIISYLQGEGFTRFLFDNQEVDITEEKTPSHFKRAWILIDRLIVKDKIRGRLLESLALATSLSKGIVHVQILGQEILYFSQNWVCPFCGDKEESFFSERFSNYILGVCSHCKGLGKIQDKDCPVCQGSRLQKEANFIFLGGESFSSALNLSIAQLALFLENLNISGLKKKIFKLLTQEIFSRVKILKHLGLDHLSLNLPLAHLSFGERQRLRLASLVGDKISGCLFILDEPSMGLSPSEKEKILFLLRKLIFQGNTVIAVEHDPLFIKSADWILELGPGAGIYGGELIFNGPSEKIFSSSSLTSLYLSGKKKILRNKSNITSVVKVKLKEEVSLPKGGLVCLCGPSGAGKSNILQQLSKELRRKDFYVETFSFITDRVNSFPLSYIGGFSPLRRLFSQLPEARVRGLTPSHFSPFHKKGRCPLCKGRGKKILDSSFFSLNVFCEECGGTGFRKEILDVRYRGYNIYEILQMTVEEAYKFLGKIPLLRKKLDILKEVSLEYIKLGQPLSSLSGGEKQRLALAKTLSSLSSSTFLLMDFPSIGLHFVDIENLLKIFDRLLKKEHSLIVVDNNPLLVLSADWLWEINEGQVIFQGSPKEWLQNGSAFSQSFLSYASFVQ